MSESAATKSDLRSREPDAWQWRYVGEGDHQWKTPSGGGKITEAELKRETRRIEQRPLYAEVNSLRDPT